MKEKEEAEENKCNNSGTERNGGTEERRNTVDTMSVLINTSYIVKYCNTIKIIYPILQYIQEILLNNIVR